MTLEEALTAIEELQTKWELDYYLIRTRVSTGTGGYVVCPLCALALQQGADIAWWDFRSAAIYLGLDGGDRNRIVDAADLNALDGKTRSIRTRLLALTQRKPGGGE